jgi:pantoate--beta-alanine ligase
MQVIRSIYEMQSLAVSLKAKGQLVGLVPTMGALHAGHASLIATAREACDTVVVSVFVNPHQFSMNEDPARYPRTPEADVALCEEAGVDVVFMPALEEMFPKGYSTHVTEELLSKPLCGQSRPQHFRGVLTVMVKLFNLVGPDQAYFGQKDAQQAAVVRKMVNDLHFCVDVVVCPTVRDADGLALGARTRDFTVSQREEAKAIAAALAEARRMVESGVRNTDRIVAEATHLIGEKRRLRVIYVAVVDRCTMEPMREVLPGKSMLTLAVWLDEVRIVDNVLL